MTVEEVKKGLRECMTGEDVNCGGCPYEKHGCAVALDKDALDYIEALESANAKLEGEIDELREALMKYIEYVEGEEE